MLPQVVRMSASFSPLKYLSQLSSEKTVVILLNKYKNHRADLSPVAQNEVRSLWNKAVFRACVDGAANFLYELSEFNSNSSRTRMPDLLSGDFDSVRPEVKEFYEKHINTQVVHTPDQNETDFTKCVKIIAEKMKAKVIDANLVIAIAGLSERFDHSMGNINTLYKAYDLLPKEARICIMYESTYICLLQEGCTTLDVATGLEGSWCGLIPVSGPVTVTSTGLKWNLNKQTLKFGDLISTSNELDGSKQVTVNTSGPLLWTIEIKRL